MAKKRLDVLLLVALAEEFEHLLGRTTRVAQAIPDPEHGGYNYDLQLQGPDGTTLTCMASLIGTMGPAPAGRHAARLLRAWNPKLVALIGLAGGIHRDVGIGDVVVADQIDDFFVAAKAVSSNNPSLPVPAGCPNDTYIFEHRGCVYRPAHDLVQELRHMPFAFRRSFTRWLGECYHRQGLLLSEVPAARSIVSRTPSFHIGHVASGPVVAASHLFCKWLQQRDATFQAIDMEAAGVAAAVFEQCHGGAQRVLLIRGVSDLANEAKGTIDDIGRGALRQYAMENALSFLTLALSCGVSTKRRSGLRFPSTQVASELAGKLTSWLTSRETYPIDGLRVLLVDDESVMLAILGEVLGNAGAIVYTAEDGTTALATLEARQIDVVLTDIIMPAMSGVELLSLISSRWPRLPCIVLSGFVDQVENRSFPQIAHMLEKPCLARDVIEAVGAATRDTVWVSLVQLYPHLSEGRHLLADAHQGIQRFLAEHTASDLVSMTLRHKLKECARSCGTDLADGVTVRHRAAQLIAEVSRLEDLATRLRRGSALGFYSYLVTLKEDLSKQYRTLDLALQVPQSLGLDDAHDAEGTLLLSAMELIDNAREAMANRGIIRVEAARLGASNAAVLRAWSRSGPIAPDVASRIFDDGYSTKGHGRGMGLALIRRLVAGSGGHIEVFTKDDDVEFVVTVPLNT